MVSLFPALLSYHFFAIAFLRAYAGIVMLFIAYEFARKRREIQETNWPIVHRVPEWLTTFGSLVIFLAGILLIVGLYTQAAAIAGFIVGLKHLVFARRYPSVFPISAGAAAFLCILCLALLSLGAGAFAFDLPV